MAGSFYDQVLNPFCDYGYLGSFQAVVELTLLKTEIKEFRQQFSQIRVYYLQLAGQQRGILKTVFMGPNLMPNMEKKLTKYKGYTCFFFEMENLHTRRQKTTGKQD